MIDDCEEVKRSFSVEFLHPVRFMMNNMSKSLSLLSMLSQSLGRMLKGETVTPLTSP